MSLHETIRKSFYAGRRPLWASVLLIPASWCYGLAVCVRNWLYDLGLLRVRRLPCKVVCVGSVTVGGSGKTAIAAMIGRTLADRGVKTAIVSRGYRSKGEAGAIASDGSGPLAGPEEIGDEPYMLARNLPGVPVIVGADRHSAGMLAVERFGSQVIVLDDGFQHRRLARDLDIVVLNAGAGLGNGRLLPAGPLREQASGLARAKGMVIMGRSEALQMQDLRSLAARFSIPAIQAEYQPVKLVGLSDGRIVDLESLRSKRVLVFSGLGLPEQFENDVSGLGVGSMQSERFPDHHQYIRADIDRLSGLASTGRFEYIVTTQKDAVKIDPKWIPGSGAFFYLETTILLSSEDQRTLEDLMARSLGLG